MRRRRPWRLIAIAAGAGLACLWLVSVARWRRGEVLPPAEIAYLGQAAPCPRGVDAPPLARCTPIGLKTHERSVRGVFAQHSPFEPAPRLGKQALRLWRDEASLVVRANSWRSAFAPYWLLGGGMALGLGGGLVMARAQRRRRQRATHVTP